VYVFTNGRRVCKTCFIRWFEKKLLYTLKKFSMVKKGDVIGYKSGKTFRDIVLEDVLRYYERKAPVKVVKLHDNSPATTNSRPCSVIDNKNLSFTKSLAPTTHPKKLGITKVAVPITTDVIASNVVSNIINSNLSKENLPVKGRVIKPLCLFLDREVLLYAKLKGLKFVKVDEKKSKMNGLLKNMEKKHPEVKHAIVNAYLKLA
jgi:hypothetical protein